VIGIAFVGCGYVADLYAATLPNHSNIRLVGVYDRSEERRVAFRDHYAVPAYASLAELLADPEIEIVVNLTNPRSHAEVTRAALLAGKHVYVEKPFASSLAEAQELVGLANGRGLMVASAPCSLLGESAQTVWRGVRDGLVGTPKLVYAQLDDGPILKMPFRDWVSVSGAPWPYTDEFRTGCTVEHAAYALTWLTAILGPVEEVVAHAAHLGDNPHLTATEQAAAPNYASAGLRFASGVVGRLTASIVAPTDRSLRIVGDEGVLSVSDLWDYGAEVTLADEGGDEVKAIPLVRPCDYPHRYEGVHTMDFSRGVAELASGVVRGSSRHLPIDHSLHVLELTMAITGSSNGRVFRPSTRFSDVSPMPWSE
jgi:predicted dehydrogenase